MDRAIVDEILEELSSALQRVETQSSAVLEFVKKKGIIKEDELAPYLERASAASSVRWRATRVRLDRLLSGLEQKEQQQHPEHRQEPQKDDERKQAGQQKEQQEGEPRKTESGKATESKAAGEPRASEAEAAREPKIVANGVEKPPAQQAPASDEKHEPPRPIQSAPAISASDSGGSGGQESDQREQPRNEKTMPSSAEKSSGKPKRSNAA